MSVDDKSDSFHDKITRQQCRHGEFVYFPHDMYIGRSLDVYGEYSQGEIELFDKIIAPGMTVIDVGANIGSHTVFMAKKISPGGFLIAIEAQEILHQLLRTNLSLNAIENVEVLHCACGSRPGELQFPVIDYARSANFGGMSLGEGDGGEIVRVIPLDALKLTRCDFIKIDVEGMENDVVIGATKLLERFRPVLYVENDRADRKSELMERLIAIRYKLYWHRPPLFNEDNFFQNSANIFGTTKSHNLLCIPDEDSRNAAILADIGL